MVWYFIPTLVIFDLTVDLAVAAAYILEFFNSLVLSRLRLTAVYNIARVLNV